MGTVQFCPLTSAVVSLLTINYYEEVCLEYHSQSNHRHCGGLRNNDLWLMSKWYCFYQNYRRFANIGYHYYITRDGEPHRCRPKDQIGVHASGWNDHSLGICYEGGLDERGLTADTRTYAQRCTLIDLLRQLRRNYPSARNIRALSAQHQHSQGFPLLRRRERICEIVLGFVIFE